MNVSVTNRIASAAIRRAILFGLIGALLMSVMMVYAVTTVDLGGGSATSISLARETFSDDTDVLVVAKNFYKHTGSPLAAAGETPTGLESDDTLPVVTNGGTGNKWIYEFEVKEAGATLWQVGENFKIEVYADDGTGMVLFSTTYVKQDSINDSLVEGVTVKAHTGQKDILGDTFNIVVTRQ